MLGGVTHRLGRRSPVMPQDSSRLLLAAAPFIPPTESGVTGAVLCGLALGWAMLAVLSARFTDQPQLWAAAPTLLMGLSGLLLVAFGSSVHEVLTWVWPPVMLALVNLDARPRPPAASEPHQTLAPLPRARGVRSRLYRRWGVVAALDFRPRREPVRRHRRPTSRHLRTPPA